MPTNPRRSATRPHVAVLLAGFALLVSAAAWLLFVARKPAPQKSARRPDEQPSVVRLITFDRPFPTEGRFVADPYVGSRVCADCHPGESALHSRSGHAVTLQPAGRARISRQLDGTTQADPEIPDVNWNFRYENDQLHIKRTATSQVQEWVADYAIGSGRHCADVCERHRPQDSARSRAPAHLLPSRRWQERARHHAGT